MLNAGPLLPLRDEHQQRHKQMERRHVWSNGRYGPGIDSRRLCVEREPKSVS